MNLIPRRQCNVPGCTTLLPHRSRAAKCESHRGIVGHKRAHMRPCKNACGRNTLKLDVCAECRASEGDYIGTGQGQKPNGKVCKECAGQSWRRPVGRPCSCGGAYSEDQSMRRR